MVKLTGPSLAQAAGGTAAGQVTFSNWKGRAYLKMRPTPKQPDTPGQVAMRAAMKFISSQWPAINPNLKLTWDDLAAEREISACNAYQAENLQRWRRRETPIMGYPATGTGSGGTVKNGAATIQGQILIIEWDPNVLMQNWGYILHAQHLGWPPARWYNIILMQLGGSPAHIKWEWKPPETGWWYFRVNSFTGTGKLSFIAHSFSVNFLP